jgi:crossover junction endodeoxyribonuclease RuvC
VIVLGVDPGTALLGYGVLDDAGGSDQPIVRAFGVFATGSGTPMPARLAELFDRSTALIETHRPSVLAIEQLFFARNVTTALAVGQARGVVLLAAARAGLEVVEYTPAEVKQAVVGYGKADKGQMQEMVRLILGLPDLPRPDDAADALAIALCHVQTAPFLSLTQTQSAGL